MLRAASAAPGAGSAAPSSEALGSGVRRAVPAFGREGEDFEAILRDADAVLELRRHRAIARDRRPAVVQHLHRIAPEIDHRLDGEEHSRLQTDALTGAPIMHDV